MFAKFKTKASGFCNENVFELFFWSLDLCQVTPLQDLKSKDR